jgi:hypothetical protein
VIPVSSRESGIFPNKPFLAGNTSEITDFLESSAPDAEKALLRQKNSRPGRVSSPKAEDFLAGRVNSPKAEYSWPGRVKPQIVRTGDPSKYFSSRNCFFYLKPDIHARRWRKLSNFQRCLWQTQKVRKDIEVDHKQYTVV